MANPTMTLIASNTVGSGGVSSVTFSSIPATYTDLVIKISARTTNGYFRDSVDVKFNGGTSAGTLKDILAQGSTVASQSTSSIQVQIEGDSGTTTNTFGNAEIYIPNYTSSNYKSLSADAVTENNSASSNALDLSASLWSNTAAITSISFAGGGNFMQYSTFYLYGINNS